MVNTRIDDAYLRDALKLLQESVSEAPICIVVVKRISRSSTDVNANSKNSLKPEPTGNDAFVFVAPANTQDAIRVSAALRQAQKALIEVTTQAMVDGAKQAESLK